ncbi:MAG: DUF3362 domain-containing protein, partial [Oscillospiraceae bacterium]
CMFFTGLNPLTMEPVYIPRDPKEKHAQRALLQYFKPENRREIIEVLVSSGNRRLIGNAPECLVAPDAKYAREQKEFAEAAKAQSQLNGKAAGKGKTPQKPSKGREQRGRR